MDQDPKIISFELHVRLPSGRAVRQKRALPVSLSYGNVRQLGEILARQAAAAVRDLESTFVRAMEEEMLYSHGDGNSVRIENPDSGIHPVDEGHFRGVQTPGSHSERRQAKIRNNG